MKKNIIIAAAFLGLMTACEKSTSKTETIENPDGSKTTITTTETTSGIVDSSDINKTRNDINNKIDKATSEIDTKADAAKQKIDATAEKTKKDLNEAGKDIKEAAAKGAGKIEESAKKLKEDLNK